MDVVNDIGIANVMAVSLSELWSCVKVEVGHPGLPVPNKPAVSVDVKQHFNSNYTTGTEFRSCVKVEVAVLGFRH